MIAPHVNLGIGEVFYDPIGHRLYRIKVKKWHDKTQLATVYCECWSLTGAASQTSVEWPVDEFYRQLVGPVRLVGIQVWDRFESGSPCSLYEVAVNSTPPVEKVKNRVDRGGENVLL